MYCISIDVWCVKFDVKVELTNGAREVQRVEFDILYPNSFDPTQLEFSNDGTFTDLTSETTVNIMEMNCVSVDVFL